MDYARYHSSAEAKAYHKTQAFTTKFISAYAPSLVLIELYFGNIKAKVGQIIITKFWNIKICLNLICF